MRGTTGVVRSLEGVRAIGYLRVSTEQQASEDKTSLADQRAAIDAKGAQLGVMVREWFEDAGYSGATVEKRPGLLSLIASCEAHRRPKHTRGVVLVLNDSRWGRFPDPDESGYWRYHLARLGWDVRFAEGDEIADGVGRSVVRLVGAAQASEYRRNLQANTIRGRRGATVQGYWAGATPPFGYVRKVCYPPDREQRILPAGVKSGKDERVQLWPDPTDAAFVRRLFELYADGTYALKGLAEVAHLERPDRSWDTGSVFYLLTNRVYVGELRSKHAQTPEPYGKDSAHPAIVSRELFERVAARLRQNKRVRRGGNRSYLATGLVTCSVCGLPLTGSGADSRGVRYYRCNGLRATATPCSRTGSCIAAHRLEAAIRDLMVGEFRRPEARTAICREIDRYFDAADARTGLPSTDAVDRTIAALEVQIQRLVAAVASGALTDAEAGGQLRDRRARLERAQDERAGVLRLAQHRENARIDRQSIYRMVDALPGLLRTMTGQDFRGAVAPWLRSATFDRDEKRLTLEIRRVPAMLATGVSFEQLPQSERNPSKAFPDDGAAYVTRSIVLGKPRRTAGRGGRGQP